MNKVILMGRLTRDPDVRYSAGENSTAVARYTLAVDRRFRRDGDSATADFIGCVAFGRQAEFAEKYLRQGTKIAITGRISMFTSFSLVNDLHQSSIGPVPQTINFGASSPIRFQASKSKSIPFSLSSLPAKTN